MDAITLFKQAACALQKEATYLDLDAARTINDADAELQDLIGRFNLARIDLNNEVNKDEPDQAHINELNATVNQLYTSIMSNESMVAYNEAKAELDGTIQWINAIVTAAINGSDPMTVEMPSQGGGCSGSCSSCGGCH